jgi:hypothetical protein
MRNAPLIRPARLFPLLLAVVLLFPGATEAQTPQRVQGHIRETNGSPIAGAVVAVTRGPDRLTQSTQTDSAGAWSVSFAEGTGDYLVHVTAIGWRGFRQRVTRGAAEPVVVVDATLAVNAVQLAPLAASARRPRPTPGPEPGREVGASESIPDGVAAALAPEQAGDLAAMAANTPGINLSSGGVTALGLADQAGTTLNGLAFSGGGVPRDVRTRTRVSFSTYDPSRGGFSSAQTAVELSPGGQYTQRSSHVSLDAPALQLSDAAAARLGREFTGVQVSSGGSGELVPERLYYSAGFDASLRTAASPSLVDPSEGLLRLGGISPDSVARLLAVLSALGVPVRGGAGNASTQRHLRAMGRIDHRKGNSVERTWGIVGFGDLSRVNPLSASFSATPGHATEGSAGSVGLQGVWSFYFGRGYLFESRAGFSYSTQQSLPLLALPEGRVRVASEEDDGGIASLAFGSNGGVATDHRFWTWETTAQLQAYTRTSRHKLKLYGNLRLDGDHQSAGGNRLGSFSFNSLADLEAGRPASFSRLLDAPAARGGEWSAALAVGDLWKRSDRLQVLYGLRFEGNRYTAAPELNAAVVEAFGVRNDHAPNSLHVSPRLGFTWRYGPPFQNTSTSTAFFSRLSVPTGSIRGGIGEFRSFPRAALLSRAQMRTGLPGSTSSLFCTGEAVPVPQWSAYANGGESPDECAGATSSTAGDAAPPVDLYAEDYRFARSWRANLAWTPSLKSLALTVDAVASLNLDQPGLVDLNFAGTPRFTLAEEGGRPVFVSAAAITPGTGVVSPVEARRSAAFGRVSELRSDLRSFSEQVTVTATPDVNIGHAFLRATYVWGRVRALQRGFSGETAGNPLETFHAAGNLDIRHQIQVQAGTMLPRGFALSFVARVASGLPYTPRVAGDVNGDGVANDRAFVFDPATVADPTLASGLRSLLSDAGAAGDCLRRQLGRAAASNSCRGPWTVSTNAQLALAGRWLHLPRRVSAVLNLSNPLAAADRVLHGSDGLRGWGGAVRPDPTLYYVRGFDPAARAFRYEVNPRFGATSGPFGVVREPFRITLDVRIDLNPSLPKQQMQHLLRAGRTLPGPRLTAAAITERYARQILDPYSAVLDLSDSLFLSPQQTRALRDAQVEYRARADSIWNDLANYMTGLPLHFDAAVAVKRQEDATTAEWALIRQEGPKIKQMLDPAQFRLLDESMKGLLNGEDIRIMTYFG